MTTRCCGCREGPAIPKQLKIGSSQSARQRDDPRSLNTLQHQEHGQSGNDQGYERDEGYLAAAPARGPRDIRHKSSPDIF